MYLSYFDENKYEEINPFFWVGGVLLEDKKVVQFESTLSQIAYNFTGSPLFIKDTELHGKFIFHGKGNCKTKKLKERVGLFTDIANFIITNQIAVRMVCIDVKAHKSKYAYPQPEYRLGLMLLLERFCEFLTEKNDIGVVFGDYEENEMKDSIVDFSQFKADGKTPMYFGRPLGRLIDTIYYTHSHHSRFLQVSDILVFLAGRYENNQNVKQTWHEIECKKIWEQIKKGTDFKIQRWP